MRRKIISVLLGLALCLGVVVLPAPQAEAHNWDVNSYWVCSVGRPTGTNVAHSWPTRLQPGFVEYWCLAEVNGYEWQYWMWWNTNTNQIGRPWPYQLCFPRTSVVCGTAGH